jgi:hypothetical protein
MNQVELKGVVVLRLRRSGDGIRNRSQLVVKRRGFHDLAFGLQFIEDLLAHLLFFVLTLALLWQRPGVSNCQETQKRSSAHEYGTN